MVTLKKMSMATLKNMSYGIALAATLSIVAFVCRADYSTVHSTIGVVAGSIWIAIMVVCMVGVLIADIKTNHGLVIHNLGIQLIGIGYIIGILVLCYHYPILFLVFMLLGIVGGKR